MTRPVDSSPPCNDDVAVVPRGAQPRFNIVILGATGAGKTQMVSRHRYNAYSTNHLATQGIEYVGWSLRDQSMRLGVWEAGGSERFRSITYPHVREAHVVVYVFDINDRASFDKLTTIANALSPMATKASVRVLVASKIDVGRRCIDDASIEAFKRQLHIDAFYPVSARTGAGVELVFAGIVQLLRDKGVAAPLPARPPSPPEMTRRRRSPAKRRVSPALASLKVLATTLTCSACSACMGAPQE